MYFTIDYVVSMKKVKKKTVHLGFTNITFVLKDEKKKRIHAKQRIVNVRE